MATGIISTGTFLLGPSWLSTALLAAASAGLAVLGVALAARLVFFRAAVAADIKAPDRVFGFFTITAGLDVLGVRLALAGHPLVTAVLSALAAAVWLVLTYGVPGQPAARAGHATRCSAASTAAGCCGSSPPSRCRWRRRSSSRPGHRSPRLLAPVSAGLWCVGLLLYLMVATLILLRWLTVPDDARHPRAALLDPDGRHRDLRAGRRPGSSAFPQDIPVVRATAGFVEGFTFALWAFGTWWIPLLVILGLWRHIRRHWPLTYEPTLWSVVFPLGMYSVATLTFGKDSPPGVHGTPRAVHDLGRRRRMGTGRRGLHRPARPSPGRTAIRIASTFLRRRADPRYDHGEGTAVTVAPITEADANRVETVADVMVRHPKLCHEDSTVGDVRQLFADDHVHAVLIMSGTRLLTVIDRADLGPEAADSAPAARLGRLSGRVTTPTAPADTALQQMIAASRRRLAVLGPDGTLLGLLCLKRSGTGFCSDENVHQRQREHLQQRAKREQSTNREPNRSRRGSVIAAPVASA